MRITTFEKPDAGRARPDWAIGLVTRNGVDVVDVEAALARRATGGGFETPRDPLAWYDMDGPWFAALKRLDETLTADDKAIAQLAEQGLARPMAACRLGSPVPRPGKIICVGLNYRDHAAEVKMDLPTSPVIFSKFPSCVIGSETPIQLPQSSRHVDYEAELAVVIGRTARHVDHDGTLAPVLGFMNANDVTARDFQKADGQWVRSKSCDTFAPLGPWIATTDEIPDPNALSIQLRLNGKTMQQSSTREFVFDVGHLIAFLSATMTLEPGDLILTGTPPGVGVARRPPVYLAAGDVLEVEIDGLGVLRNPVVGS